MPPRPFATGRAGWLLIFAGIALTPALPAHAQPPASLAEAFEQAWARHPLAQALPARQAEVAAQRRAADAWTAQPGALELRAKTDRPGTDRGAQEFEFGVALPLWWPGQRTQSQALAAQSAQALSATQANAQLQLAGELRQAWWTWQRAQAEQALIGTQVAHAQALARDVHQRVQAGDLARADAHQAESALARAEADLARAESVTLLAWQVLQGPLGSTDTQAEASASTPLAIGAEPEPVESDEPDLALHPLVRESEQQAALAQQTASLADTQSRANPELLLGTVHSRDQRNEPRQRQLTIGLRLPWGDSPALQAQAARAHAEATELSAQAQLQRQRVTAAQAGARARCDAARRALTAAQRRAQLANETLGFYDRAFQLGESDLPTRLRIAQDAQDAARQASLAAIDLAAAVSAWRQAAGLLPQ